MFARSTILAASLSLLLGAVGWPVPADAHPQDQFTATHNPFVSCQVGKSTKDGTTGTFKSRTFRVWAQCTSGWPVTVVRIQSRVEYVLKAGKNKTNKTQYGDWETAIYPQQLKSFQVVAGGAVSEVKVLYSKSASISVKAIYVEVDAPYDYSSWLSEPGGKGNVGRTYQVA